MMSNFNRIHFRTNDIWLADRIIKKCRIIPGIRYFPDIRCSPNILYIVAKLQFIFLLFIFLVFLFIEDVPKSDRISRKYRISDSKVCLPGYPTNTGPIRCYILSEYSISGIRFIPNN